MSFSLRQIFFFSFLIISYTSCAQNFTKKDSLRGFISKYRSCYNVSFYDLDITIDDYNKSLVKSSNTIYFTTVSDFSIIQIDLSKNMNISYIEFEGNELKYKREYDAVYVFFNRKLIAGENASIKVYYHGIPKEANNPPWDGGFSWEKDNNNKPWISVSCQGLGASQWWPCKDHQSDEPDSMRITYKARSPLKVISNGNLVNDTLIWDDNLNSLVTRSEWFVNYPINSYNVSLNIGDYMSFSDSYISENDTLNLDYYVLSYNIEKAKMHFKQVIPMLKCFENLFGQYPFLDDGYALVETPYLGMEHQSAIAYGNNYLSGYLGNKLFTDGLDFDYIIIHETAHEWWGNSLTTRDIADMWVHEAFGTYSEALYVECIYGYSSMLSYINNHKKNVKNDKPIIGPYNVNKKGSTDMYFKGALMLNTLRSIIDNDDLWFNMLIGITKKFKHQIIEGNDIINFINDFTNMDLSVFFSQYLNYSNLPVFEYKFHKNGRNITLLYRWNAIKDFNMPILVNNGNIDFWLKPESEWKEKDLKGFDINEFKIRDDLFFIEFKKY